MFRNKVVIIMYVTTEPVTKGIYYGKCRLASYGTLFEKTLEKLIEKYGPQGFTATNVIKL